MRDGMRDADRTSAIVWATVALVSLAPWVALAVLSWATAVTLALGCAVVLVAAAGLLS